MADSRLAPPRPGRGRGGTGPCGDFVAHSGSAGFSDKDGSRESAHPSNGVGVVHNRIREASETGGLVSRRSLAVSRNRGDLVCTGLLSKSRDNQALPASLQTWPHRDRRPTQAQQSLSSAVGCTEDLLALPRRACSGAIYALPHEPAGRFVTGFLVPVRGGPR